MRFVFAAVQPCKVDSVVGLGSLPCSVLWSCADRLRVSSLCRFVQSFHGFFRFAYATCVVAAQAINKLAKRPIITVQLSQKSTQLGSPPPHSSFLPGLCDPVVVFAFFGRLIRMSTNFADSDLVNWLRLDAYASILVRQTNGETDSWTATQLFPITTHPPPPCRPQKESWYPCELFKTDISQRGRTIFVSCVGSLAWIQFNIELFTQLCLLHLFVLRRTQVPVPSHFQLS